MLGQIKRYVEKINGKIAVAFSGGVDSSLVALASKEVADAVTIKSEFVHEYIVRDAKEFAKRFGINHVIAETNVLDGEIKWNPANRCYLCKKKIAKQIKEMGYDVIMDGTNRDDLAEKRPGLVAKEEEGIVSPLAELGMGKSEIRETMGGIDGEVAKRPSESCLATRIPFNSEMTNERLRRIEKAEEKIRSVLDFIRVRDHFPLARLETDGEEFEKLLAKRDKIVVELKKLGYSYVTMDLEGYKPYD